MDTISLFVPGRLCLFGEHSDWAGAYRRINSEIRPGLCIVTGLREGIYARAEKSGKLELSSVLTDGTATVPFECEMDPQILRNIAAEGGFYSYIAGVASFLQTHYHIGGLKLDCYKMDMPIAQGLSSSAAICVMAARAFNRLYKLNLTTRGEMEAAYRGEMFTPSRCGRMDQACAYGSRPVMLRFDGDTLDVDRLKVGAPLYWVYSSLNASKDTVKILQDLNAAYPFPANKQQKTLHEALGRKNEELVEKAISLIAGGNAEALGTLMLQAQELFDKSVAPQSEELISPKLHEILIDPEIQPFIYGGKGVGSQGDGSVQFLAKDEKSQTALTNLLKGRGLSASSVTLNAQHGVTRAIIPVAGYGTRMFPATKALKKELIPVVNKDGLAVPALFTLLKELNDAGVDRVCLITPPGEEDVYKNLFIPDEKRFDKLSPVQQKYELWLRSMAEKITFVEQPEPLGFGHAVYQARSFAQDSPVLLLLSDHIYESYDREHNCIQQILSAFDQTEKLTVSMSQCGMKDVVHYGIMAGEWMESSELLALSEIAEKPGIDYAASKLNMGTDSSPRFFSVFGLYVLTPEVFKSLERRLESTSGGEIGLTEAMEETRASEGAVGLLMRGAKFDIGLPAAYRKAVGGYGRSK
jgi:UTP-glucose-1-phosphate uridylyltransferase